MVIDAHAHLFHPSWYPKAFNDQLAASLGRGQHASPRAAEVLLRALSDDSGESTIRAMDEAGIDHRIVLILDWGLELGEPELSIEAIHEAVMGICQRFPDRFTGFAGLDPRRPEAAELLGWAVDSLGARGLKLHPTSEGWTLHDESTLRLVEIATQRGLPVLVHVGTTFPVLTDRNAGPPSLLAMAALFPQTTFVAGHAGFKRWREFRSDGHLPANVLLDVSGWQSLDDGGEIFAEELLEIVRGFPGQVVFGTDSPFFGLPASGADAHWVERVRGILSQPGAPEDGSFFAHPLLIPREQEGRTVTREHARERLAAYLVEELGVPQDLIHDDALLMDAGLIDSLGVITIVAFCEDELGCVVPPDEISPDAFRTLGSLVHAVVERWRAN